jgi:cell division protease FtsH
MMRPELEQKIAVLLGGRAAEKLVFSMLSTGAADDLAKATDIARDMVTRYGMDEGLGYVAFEPRRQSMLDLPAEMQPRAIVASEDTQRRIDSAIRRIVMSGFTQATGILQANRDVLERGARALLEKETLDETAIRALTQTLRRPPPVLGAPPPSPSAPPAPLAVAQQDGLVAS